MVRYISVEGATIRVTGAIRVRDAVKHRVTVRLQSVYTQPKNTILRHYVVSIRASKR